MIAVVATVAGTFAVDLETEEVGPWEEPFEAAPQADVRLPRLVAAAASGATVVAVVGTRPPLVVSHDAGTTWRESGRGLPEGRAIAIADEDPDTAVFASRNRLYVTRDGAVFWKALPVELPEIEAVSLRD
jgi:photosystem II stability/assembly factor-like uncharacterized protein